MFPLLAWLGSFACASSPGVTPLRTERAPEESARPTTSPGEPSPSAPTDGWFACGDRRCRAGSSAAELVAFVLRSTEPLVLGFGEAHAPAGAATTPTVRRFQSEVLPSLSPESSALVVELLAPPSGCDGATERTDETAREVTSGQAATNQNDYLALGTESRRLGVVPDILRASCDDLRAIADAEDLGVFVMMETIARLSVTTVERYLAREKPGRPRVLAYGGMLHNDLAPREERRSWSYGPDLERRTAGRYVELDLVVPELVGDAALWAKFDFSTALDALTEAPLERFVLIERSPRSFALVWPGTRPR